MSDTTSSGMTCCSCGLEFTQAMWDGARWWCWDCWRARRPSKATGKIVRRGPAQFRFIDDGVVYD